MIPQGCRRNQGHDNSSSKNGTKSSNNKNSSKALQRSLIDAMLCAWDSGGVLHLGLARNQNMKENLVGTESPCGTHSGR